MKVSLINDGLDICLVQGSNKIVFDVTDYRKVTEKICAMAGCEETQPVDLWMSYKDDDTAGLFLTSWEINKEDECCVIVKFEDISGVSKPIEEEICFDSVPGESKFDVICSYYGLVHIENTADLKEHLDMMIVENKNRPPKEKKSPVKYDPDKPFG